MREQDWEPRWSSPAPPPFPRRSARRRRCRATPFEAGMTCFGARRFHRHGPRPTFPRGAAPRRRWPSAALAAAAPELPASARTQRAGRAAGRPLPGAGVPGRARRHRCSTSARSAFRVARRAVRSAAARRRSARRRRRGRARCRRRRRRSRPRPRPLALTVAVRRAVKATSPVVPPSKVAVSALSPGASSEPEPWMSAVKVSAVPASVEAARAAEADREIVGVDAGRTQRAASLDDKSTRRPRAPLISSWPLPTTRAEREVAGGERDRGGVDGARGRRRSRRLRLRRMRRVVPCTSTMTSFERLLRSVRPTAEVDRPVTSRTANGPSTTTRSKSLDREAALGRAAAEQRRRGRGGGESERSIGASCRAMVNGQCHARQSPRSVAKPLIQRGKLGMWSAVSNLQHQQGRGRLRKPRGAAQAPGGARAPAAWCRS